MIKKLYHIYRSQEADFEKALGEILCAIATNEKRVIRIVFFGSPADNNEFSEQRQKIELATRAKFSNTPMLAYVAQAPLCSTLAAEVTTIEEELNEIVYHEDYILINGSEIISGGIYSDTSLGIDQQADAIFSRIEQILKNESVKIDDIVRQWNYIERITHLGERGQHYQLFNDSRSHFYNAAQWTNGYPAATGIGTQTGGVIVVFDAVKDSAKCSRAIDNPLQISAHAYSQQVLINNTDTHKTTPKFERARHIAGEEQMIYISGTAAIRGEESCQQDIVGQTALTMENIDHLISIENQATSDVMHPTKMEYATMRAYLKHCDNLDDAKTWLNEHYPNMQTLYLWADICREELLIEIEGIATQID